MKNGYVQDLLLYLSDCSNLHDSKYYMRTALVFPIASNFESYLRSISDSNLSQLANYDFIYMHTFYQCYHREFIFFNKINNQER